MFIEKIRAAIRAAGIQSSQKTRTGSPTLSVIATGGALCGLTKA